jgi:DNA replication and repair protein RecF
MPPGGRIRQLQRRAPRVERAMWISRLVLRDVRNIEAAEVSLGAELNVFVGANAQGKTSLLEAVGLLARGRSFRTDDARRMIRSGAARLEAAAESRLADRSHQLEVRIAPEERALRVNGRAVSAGEYAGHIEVAVYSGERLRLIGGGARERRQYLERGAAALWPAFRRLLRDFEKALAQRNAALASGARDIEVWDERFTEIAGELRVRRQAYVDRLNVALERGFKPAGERYSVRLDPELKGVSAAAAADDVKRRLAELRAAERRSGRSLAGPQRDRVGLLVGERDVAQTSSGQGRSLLLALTLASLDLYIEERGEPAVALLDDLDSELDKQRLAELCRFVRPRAQALITSAHPEWASALDGAARVFEVNGGRIQRRDAGEA